MSIDEGKAFDKIQHPFLIKKKKKKKQTLHKVGIEGTLPQHNKSQVLQTHS